MVRDFDRGQLPPGYVWNLQDYFPNVLGAPLRKRGAWANASSALGAQTSVSHTFVAAYTAGNQLLAVDSATSTSTGPTLWQIASSASAASIGGLSAGVAGVNVANIVYYRSYAIFTFLTDAAAGNGPAYYDGATLSGASAFGSSLASGNYAAVYKDRLVVGRLYNALNRIQFSDAGSPTAFSSSLGYIDTSHDITGIAALANVLLVFSVGAVERIRGATPPPGSDMVLEKVSDYGCVDFRSIAAWQNRVIYADTNGVYMTDGAATIDLTDRGEMRSYYQTLLASYTTTWRLVGGVYRNFYFLVINNGTGSGTFQDCLVCDLNRHAWFRMQNFNFRSFAQATGTFQDFYAACGDQGRVAKLTSIFTPGSSYTTDADGDAVVPILETGTFRGLRPGRGMQETAGLTHWKRLYATYDLRDAGTDNPTITVSYITDPASTSYTALARTIDETTALTRAGRSFGISGARGGKIVSELGLKLAQSNPSSDTRIYSIEGEYETIEPSRLAQ